MDKNQATGLILLFGILFAYFTFFAPKPDQLPAAKKEAAKLAADTGKKASQEEIAYSGLRQAGLADSSITIDTIPLILENEDIRVSISPLGGQVREVQLKKYKTWDGKPLILLSGKRSSQHFFVNASGKRLDLSILPFSGKVQKTGDSSVLELKSKLSSMAGLSQRFVLPAKGFELKLAVNAGIAGINPIAELVFVQDAAQL
jgi:YidC/Oxa1 family membrane protein insertase